MRRYDLLLLGQEMQTLQDSIAWEELGIQSVRLLYGTDELAGMTSAPDILITSEQLLREWPGETEPGKPCVILYCPDPRSGEHPEADIVISTLNAETVYAALRTISIRLNLEDANRKYYSGEVVPDTPIELTPYSFWENTLMDNSVMRKAEEMELAAHQGGIRLAPGDRYILSVFVIYSHHAKFKSWKPDVLESVSKQLIQDVMEPGEIPVIISNRVLYFTIHRFSDALPSNYYSARREKVTATFLNEWGMNVFAASGIPCAVSSLWRQRMDLILEFDQFYSNIGRSAVNTVVDSVRYLTENCAEGIPTRKELACKLGFNADYLSRTFHQQAGITLSDYLDEVRIRQARQLLCDKSLPISRISDQLGYSNFSSFTQMFRRKSGMTPSEYRKKHAIVKS